MATLRYLNTFIDEEPTGRVFEARSKSWPQLGGLGHATEEIEENMEMQAASYVAELEGKWSVTFGERPRMSAEPETQMALMTTHLPTRSAQEAAPEVPPAVQNAAVAEISQAPTSKGSRGHPVVCFRPCIRLAKGPCEMGDACDYCHYKHPRYVTPDKCQWFLLNLMDPWSLLVWTALNDSKVIKYINYYSDLLGCCWQS
jgi:hypothetical protein